MAEYLDKQELLNTVTHIQIECQKDSEDYLFWKRVFDFIKKRTAIKFVKEDAFDAYRADAIAQKMASELKTARMDGRREGVADGYKAGWNAALAMIEEKTKNEYK